MAASQPPTPQLASSSSWSSTSGSSPSLPLTAYPAPGTLGSEKISYDDKIEWLTETLPYECHYCEILFHDDILHDLHMMTHSSDNPFKCVCGYDASGTESPKYFFTAHVVLAEHESNLTPRYSTNFQWIPRFLAPGSLNTPPISVESFQNWLNTDAIYECTFCKMLFMDDVIHDMHMQTHHGNGFTCTCPIEWDKYQFNLHNYTFGHKLGPRYNISHIPL